VQFVQNILNIPQIVNQVRENDVIKSGIQPGQRVRICLDKSQFGVRQLGSVNHSGGKIDTYSQRRFYSSQQIPFSAAHVQYRTAWRNDVLVDKLEALMIISAPINLLRRFFRQSVPMRSAFPRELQIGLVIGINVGIHAFFRTSLITSFAIPKV